LICYTRRNKKVCGKTKSRFT